MIQHPVSHFITIKITHLMYHNQRVKARLDHKYENLLPGTDAGKQDKIAKDPLGLSGFFALSPSSGLC
jgi:hypothetical protein